MQRLSCVQENAKTCRELQGGKSIEGKHSGYCIITDEPGDRKHTASLQTPLQVCLLESAPISSEGNEAQKVTHWTIAHLQWITAPEALGYHILKYQSVTLHFKVFIGILWTRVLEFKVKRQTRALRIIQFPVLLVKLMYMSSALGKTSWIKY